MSLAAGETRGKKMTRTPTRNGLNKNPDTNDGQIR